MIAPDEAALLRHIVEAPDDDGPRLVYADHLLERGDPRGELIQLQVKLAGEPEDGARRRAMRIAENKLLAAHGETWLAPLRALLPPPSVLEPYRFDWSRGFVERITLPLDCVARLADLLAVAPLLRGLDVRPSLTSQGLYAMTPPAVAGTLRAPELARLRELELRLVASGNGIAHELAAASVLANLRTLNIRASVWGDAATYYGTGPQTSLALDDEGAAVLATAPHLASVTSLSLEANRLTLLGVHALARGPWRLRALDLAYNALEPEGLVAALTGPATAELESLRISGVALAPAEARRLATAAAAFPRLAELDLESCALGAAGGEALFGALALPALRRLRVERNSLADAGARALAACAGLAVVTSLEAGHNRLGQKGGLAIASSPHLAHLERLLLNEPRWKADMEEAFIRSPHLANAKIYFKGKLLARARIAAEIAARPPDPEPAPKPKRARKKPAGDA